MSGEMGLGRIKGEGYREEEEEAMGKEDGGR